MPLAIVMHRTGGPDALVCEDVPLRAPNPGEALVRHSAIGVNFIDIYQRTGLYPVPALPSGVGSEAAGVVEAIGAGVEQVRVGERVAYVSGPLGAYSEARCIDADRLIPLPDDIADDVAAAMMLKGMTVEYLIRRCHPVAAGQTVLWHAAAGGVGLIACQWLAKIGARVVGTVSSAEKAELARAHGATHTVVYTEKDFRQRVRELTGGRGVPVVYDSVGKATFDASLDCLEPRGWYVGFGNASGKPEPFDITTLARKGSLFLTRPTLAHYTATRDELLQSASALFDVVQSGQVRIRIGQRFPLAQASAAHRALEARQTTGSTVLVP
jgi:NADPH:quinone reductase